MNRIKSCLPGLISPAIPEPNAALMLALQYQFEQTEMMSADDILSKQLKQAELLLKAAKTVPFYQGKLPKSQNGLTLETWQSIPILTRQNLASAGDLIINKQPPAGHDELRKITSSGSTGMPVTAYGTSLTQTIWDAYTLRDHLWHKRDLNKKLLAIRPGVSKQGKPVSAPNWGSGTGLVYQTGPSGGLSSSTDIEGQLRWLAKQKPSYLLSLPSNLKELALLSIEKGERLDGLLQVRSMGEKLTESVRELCREAWGTEITDVYSSQEVGYIASQCPEHGNYHIHSDSVLVEILDADGNPCQQGEIGRVVVTTLLNLGAPLIRYDIGDYAVMGHSCDCGRGSQVLQNIMGRERNMMRTPDGKTSWPDFRDTYIHVKKIKQIQFEQTEPDHLLVRLVVSEPLYADEENLLIRLFRERYDYEFRVSFDYLSSIPRSKSGKFEDFIYSVSDKTD